MYTSPVGSDGPFLGIFLPVRIEKKKQCQTERGKKYFVYAYLIKSTNLKNKNINFCIFEHKTYKIISWRITFIESVGIC